MKLGQCMHSEKVQASGTLLHGSITGTPFAYAPDCNLALFVYV